jgi:hypothetical protein
MRGQSELNVFLLGIRETVEIANLVLEYVNQRLDPFSLTETSYLQRILC